MATAQERHDAVENRKKENQESFEDLLYSPDYEEKKHIKAAVEAIKLARIQLRDERKKRDDEKKEERRKTEDKEERTIIQTSDSYYEQVQGHKFARKTTSGKVELVDEVVIGSKIITPVHGGELEEGRETVILPPRRTSRVRKRRSARRRR